jgi:transposase-like protein
MTEETRHEIVQRRQAGATLRSIAEEFGISRGAVNRALQRVQAQREGRTALTP